MRPAKNSNSAGIRQANRHVWTKLSDQEYTSGATPLMYAA